MSGLTLSDVKSHLNTDLPIVSLQGQHVVKCGNRVDVDDISIDCCKQMTAMAENTLERVRERETEREGRREGEKGSGTPIET